MASGNKPGFWQVADAARRLRRGPLRKAVLSGLLWPIFRDSVSAARALNPAGLAYARRYRALGGGEVIGSHVARVMGAVRRAA